MNLNDLSISIYSSGTTSILNPEPLRHAQGIGFTTQYPGGLYGSASFYVARNITQPWEVKGGQRVVIRNGQNVVFEGRIDSIQDVLGRDADQGNRINVTGYWGSLLARRRWNKPWCDGRISDDVWRYDTTETGSLLCTYDKLERIRLTPKNEQWGLYMVGRCNYVPPTGETIKRITWDYDFSEEAKFNPFVVTHYDSAGPTNTDKPNWVDNSLTTSSTVTFTTGDYIYVDIPNRDICNFVQFVFGATVNGNASILTAEMWNADPAVLAWANVAITDGTIAVAGKTFSGDGKVTFTMPPTPDNTTAGGKHRLWIRFAVSANLTANIIIKEVYIGANQAWQLLVYDYTNAFSEFTLTANGSGSHDEALDTASSDLGLCIQSLATQLAPGNNSVYGQYSSIFVYTELGAIDPTEVIKDVRAKITDLNSTDTYIGANAMTLTPFRTEGWSETIADLLMRIASYGDTSINDWAVYVRESEFAPTPNGEPVLVYELQPALTDYDYQVSLAELDPPVTIERGFDDIWNWIVIQYTDANGFLTFITPDNDATLKDTTSITDYGQRDYLLTFTSGGTAEMIKYARRFLAARKDPVYRIPGPIQVRGSIMSKNGGMTPVCQVRAGKRIRIMDYLPDLSGTGLTLLISATDYDSSSEICSITAGVPDSLSVIIAQLGAGLLK